MYVFSHLHTVWSAVDELKLQVVEDDTVEWYVHVCTYVCMCTYVWVRNIVVGTRLSKVGAVSKKVLSIIIKAPRCISLGAQCMQTSRLVSYPQEVEGWSKVSTPFCTLDP